jgi:DNA helicase-2/ATP-dependent DNA helicase PcrA
MNFLKNLNPQQKEAVLDTEGPVLIIAGAGSGKTRALTTRAAYLIYKGLAPENLLAVTFTNKAAEEMRGRIIDLLKKEGFKLQEKDFRYIGTFHSIALKILKETTGKKFSIFDEDDQLALIKQEIKKIDLSPGIFKPRTVLEAISRAKNELLDNETYRAQTKNFWEEQISKVFQYYQTALKKQKALDFDDILLETLRLFSTRPQTLSKYQDQFQYILVDEYQDTNTAQYILIQKLAKKHGRVCVVGDVDQAIYGWRGADFRNILKFEQDWPQAKLIKLEENYRSTQNVLRASNSVIANNELRKDKSLWTQNEAGELIKVTALGDGEQEAEFIAKKILELKITKQIKLNDCAVLFRTGAQSRLLEEAFIRNEIPYQLVGGVKFYQRKEIKDILSYLKILENAYDLTSLKRIANVPPRGLGKLEQKEIVYLQKLILGLGPVKNPSKKQIKIAEFAVFMNAIKTLAKKKMLSELTKKIIEKTGYVEWLDEKTEEGAWRADNVRELVSLASNFDNLGQEGLPEFLNQVALIQEADEIGRQKNSEKKNQDRVLLMTMHAVKGLEFPIVFVAGLEENLFPHKKNLEGEKLEEERRLCYVALTRAKKIAWLTFARQRKIFGNFTVNPPSRFLIEIPEKLVEFEEFEEEEILKTVEYD